MGEKDSWASDVKTGLHQGSVLSPLLLVVAMEITTQELWEGLSWKLLFADDRILVAESADGLHDKIIKLKHRMERRCFKMNKRKAKEQQHCYRCPVYTAVSTEYLTNNQIILDT